MKKWLLLTFICTTISLAQDTPSQIETVDFKTGIVDVTLVETRKEIEGYIVYDFDILETIDSVVIDARNLKQLEVTLNDNQEVTDPYNGDQIILRSDRFKAGTSHKVEIFFTSVPNKAFYFIDENSDDIWEQAWTQGQGKYTSNWLPSLDDVNDKIAWDIKVSAPLEMKAISNGSLVSHKENVWHYAMSHPMSSYLVAIACADYGVLTTTSKSGIPIEQYYYSGDKKKAELTYRETKDLFDILEKEIGVDYPWEIYKQAPVKDFLYSGMENTTLTIFNDQFMVDSLAVNDRNYITVNAHEMAHHWFGNLVTASSGKHHWLQEGFATYYAALAEKELLGNEHFQVKLYENLESLVRQERSGKATEVLNPKASSLTFYQHGAWVLHALQDKVGLSRFRESVKKFLMQYQFDTATTDDFITIVEQVAEIDLTDFKYRWLESTEFPTMEAIDILKKDKFMQRYFELMSLRERTFNNAYPFYKEILKKPVSTELVKEMVMQLQTRSDDRRFVLIRDAASLDIPEVNQMIALTATEINEVNRDMIYSFLDESSYLTRESSLFLIWDSAVDKKKILSNARELWAGEINPSLDLAWIAMALNTEGFKQDEMEVFLKRMQSYTSPKFSTSTRTAAFDYLLNLQAFGLKNVEDLMLASMHHSWRFYSSSRDVLRALEKNQKNKALIDAAVEKFTEAQQQKLQRILSGEI